MKAVVTTFCAMIWIGTASSIATDVTTTTPPPAKVAALAERVDFSGSIMLGNVRLHLTPPAGWRTLSENGNTKISFYSPDTKSVMTVRVGSDRSTLGLPLSEKTRAIITKRYSNAVVKLETAWFSSNLQGRAVDFERRDPIAGEPTTTRFAATCIGGNLVEVIFTTPSTQFFLSLPTCEQFLRRMKSIGAEEEIGIVPVKALVSR